MEKNRAPELPLRPHDEERTDLAQLRGVEDRHRRSRGPRYFAQIPQAGREIVQAVTRLDPAGRDPNRAQVGDAFDATIAHEIEDRLRGKQPVVRV